jgi:leukotriene-A4 hydrolase
VFLPYVKDYVSTFTGKSITSYQWKDHLFEYFTKHGGPDKVTALNSIDFDVEYTFLWERLSS